MTTRTCSRVKSNISGALEQFQLDGLSDATNDLKGSMKELNIFHNYETEKITCKASDMAEYIELFGSSARDRHALNVIL